MLPRKNWASPLVSLLVVLAFGSMVRADLIALWTFETTPPVGPGPHLADQGAGVATGFHALPTTVFDNPAGNGSAESFSSNMWSVGDYYQFQVNLTGFQRIVVSWDQTRSGTGPGTFDFQYSTDGINFTTFLDDYTVLTNVTVPPPDPLARSFWSPTVPRQSIYTFTQDLSSVTALDGAPSAYFRLTAQVGGAAAGTNRVDNFLVESVPEPASVTLLGLGVLGMAGAALRKRWRKQAA